MNDLPDTIDKLAERLATLEQRVFALEHPAEATIHAPAQIVNIEPPPLTPTLDLSNAGGIFPVLGKAMLGIAGAYVLRAVAEANVAPQPVVAAIAIVYAILWLVWAVRVPLDAWFASTTYACTSALILAPMLWELTFRFQVLPPAATAGALAAFVASAFALTWKQHRGPALWIAAGTAAALAVALAIATHQIAPFASVLLLLVLLAECGAALQRWANIRILAAAAADLCIWALIYIYSSPQSTRVDYQPLSAGWLIAPGILLFCLYAASVSIAALVQRKGITAFETIQTTTAFLLAACGVLFFGPAASAPLLGILCLAMAAVGYTAVFLRFHAQSDHRNYVVFSTWSAALFLSGSYLCIPDPYLSSALGAAALAATIAGTRLNKLTFALHGVLYLFAAAGTAGLATYLFHALAGAMPAAPSWTVYITAAFGIACYAVIKPSDTEPWKPQALHLAIAAVGAASATALLVQALAAIITLGGQPAAHHLAFIRTLILCAMALGLAFAGAHWRRRELTRIGYATLALLAVKLVVEDLALGHLAYIAASIFLFAITLIAVPRVAHLKQRT